MQRKNAIISLMALLFGTGSWIAITGMWLEMPLLIQRLPEGWRLPSQVNIVIQLANIGPIIYWYAQSKRMLNDISATHIQMIIGIISCIILINAWNYTMNLFGDKHSIILFVATFGLALVDCTSSVTFLPFMARFDPSYMTPYLVGEGLSGFFPSIVAMIQGVGEDHQECADRFNSNNTMKDSKLSMKPIEPRFSIEAFFLSLFITISISYAGFFVLKYLPVCRKEMKRIKQLGIIFKNVTNDCSVVYHGESYSISFNGNNIDNNNINEGSLSKNFDNRKHLKKIYYYLLFLMCWNCFTTFGFFPSIQPYSALPYGVNILHYVVIVSGLAYPAGCFLGMWIEDKSLRMMNVLTIIGSLIGLYIMVCAIMSPKPPLVDTQFGGIVIIIAWISFVGVLSYTKTMITVWICEYATQTGMFWVGMNTQLGAALGAGFIFILINYTQLFNEC